MNKSTIYSIGHGRKAISQLIDELHSFSIEYVFDVRTNPFSKFSPHFNSNLLEIDLRDKGITYVYIGESLGGLPKDPNCYIDGKVDYKKISETSYFVEAIDLLAQANNEKMKIALLCSESKPEQCHRSKLIGQALAEKNIQVNHIISSGLIKSQNEVMNILNKGNNLSDLFGDDLNLTSRKAY